jgi:hypothetical protein
MWNCLLGYVNVCLDITLLTGLWHLIGIWHCLVGYDAAYWDMTLITGIWHFLLRYDTAYWDMTLLTGIWHCLLGYDTVYWDVTLLTGYWLLIIWEKIVISSSRVKLSNKNLDFWRWDRCAVSKFWEPIIQWCGIPFQKNGYLIHTNVKSLKPAENI